MPHSSPHPNGNKILDVGRSPCCRSKAPPENGRAARISSSFMPRDFSQSMQKLLSSTGTTQDPSPACRRTPAPSAQTHVVRKVKLPGVISLRKDFPICPIPNGSFFLEVRCTFLKLTKIPCAVSGLKIYRILRILGNALEGLEHQVELTDIGEIMLAAGRTADVVLVDVNRSSPPETMHRSAFAAQCPSPAM